MNTRYVYVYTQRQWQQGLRLCILYHFKCKFVHVYELSSLFLLLWSRSWSFTKVKLAPRQESNLYSHFPPGTIFRQLNLVTGDPHGKADFNRPLKEHTSLVWYFFKSSKNVIMIKKIQKQKKKRKPEMSTQTRISSENSK